jgi:hypothetical protein
MHSTRYILWEEQGQWYGYLQDYPDCMAYGKSFEDLQFKLRDLQRDLDGQEDDRSLYATAVSAPPRVYPPPPPGRSRSARALRRFLLSMFTNP